MNRDFDSLIDQLSASAAPVRRLAPPMARALIWLGVIGVVCAAAILKLSNLPAFTARAADPRFAGEMFAVLATGVAGVIAAFHVSVPDRSRLWALLPAPFAILWIVLSGVGCWRDWAEQTQRGWGLGQSAYCFRFLLGIGIPLAALLLFSLRRASPLQPRLVAAVGSVGVAGLAAFVLQFFHPFDVTVMDFATHLVALLLLIGLSSLSGRLSLSGGR